MHRVPTRPNLRRLRLASAVLLGAAGFSLSGQALYIHAKALLAQVLLERAFSASLATASPVKPWSWADTWPVARISLPRLGASAIALAGGSGQALAFGPAHLPQTPAAAEPGAAVYAAHRDTHFAFLRHVLPGDLIEVTRSDGSRHQFRVRATSVVHWDASGVDPHGPGRSLVLATCWPFEARTAGPLRFLVHADAVEDPAPASRPSSVAAR